MDQDQPSQPPVPAEELSQAHAQIAALTAEVAALKAQCDHADGASWVGEEGPRRLRNLLATLRSVFRRSMDTAASLEDAALHFIGRFDALARFEASLMGGRSVELEDIVRDELLSVVAHDEGCGALSGPPVLLDHRQAPLIGLAIHELVTNAVKFGALMTPGATLSVSWRYTGEDRRCLAIRWVESNVPVIAPAPLRVGFGREFIEHALPYQLRADTRFELRPGGILCEIILPMLDDVADA